MKIINPFFRSINIINPNCGKIHLMNDYQLNKEYVE